MNSSPDYDPYLKNPDQLIILLKNVIEDLASQENKDQTTMMETQLREISRTIEKLEKMGVDSPDALRAEKTRLVASLSIQSESYLLLNRLADGLNEIILDLNDKIGRNPDQTKRKRQSGKRVRLPRTDNKTLRNLIIEALQHFGGSANINDVLKFMEAQLEGKFLPGDLVWRETTRDHAWQNNACWERYEMVKDGILRSDSPRGTWELS